LPTDSYFEISRDLNKLSEYYCHLKVAGDPRSDIQTPGWPEIINAARRWAAIVNAPDLWEELRVAHEFLDDAPGWSVDNRPFTEGERVEISAQFREIRKYIQKTYSLPDNKLSRIETMLEEASEASHRVGRKDWLMMFNGAVFSLILTDLLPPQAAQRILFMALHGLGHMFGIGGPLSVLPPG
jgi:hypothetical protein